MRPLPRAVRLLRASHPLPTAAVTAMVTAVAASAGRGVRGTTGVGAAVLAGQLSVGWSNDALDAGRDTAAHRPDKPTATAGLDPRHVGVAAATALAACVPLSLLSGRRAAAAHLTGVLAGGWAYNLGLKGTALSPLPYAVGFGSLPALVTLGLPGRPAPAWWVVSGAALLGVGAHLVNVLPDLEDDAAAGVRGLPHRLGRDRVRRVGPAVLCASAALFTVGPGGRPGRADVAFLTAAGAVAVAGTVLPRDPRSRAPFRASIAAAALTVAALIRRGSSLTRPAAGGHAYVPPEGGTP